MTQPDPSRFFDQKIADNYDAQADNLKAIGDNLHLLIGLVLQDLPDDARILCVGAGTGTEIVHLAALHPNWRFVALEPSPEMLAKCREKMEKHGFDERCRHVNGFLKDIAPGESFDAVLCLLVTQFMLDPEERQAMFDGMARRLRAGGYLINAEISYDVRSAAFDAMAQKWGAMRKKSGATKDDTAQIIAMMLKHVAVAPPAAIEAMLKKSGFAMPILFFQSLFIHAWYSQK